MSLHAVEITMILAGAALGGFVNGLTGFGTALTAVPIWVSVLPPPLAAALGAAAGVIGQLQTIHLIWSSIDWRRVGPFIAAGLFGVPIGTWLLPLVEPRQFKLGIGCVLIVYCGFLLLADRLSGTASASSGGRAADALVGFGGGIMSGIAGLAGPLPIMWATFKPWSRNEKRALYQSFNCTILFATVCSSAAAGLLPSSFWWALLLCVPATIAGARLGAAAYRRLDDRRYDRVVVTLLLVMGVSLIIGNR